MAFIDYALECGSSSPGMRFLLTHPEVHPESFPRWACLSDEAQRTLGGEHGDAKNLFSIKVFKDGERWGSSDGWL